ncbi:MAG: HAMP domain-containing sensor histidine kinase [Patescibacteria group bacterium]
MSARNKKPSMKFDFVTIASHQLRTPLSAMKWFLEMLIAGNAGRLTGRQREFISEIYKSNERMIRLVNDLLIVSKITQKNFHLSPHPFIFERMVASMVKEVKPITQSAQITVVSKFDPTQHTCVNADEDKIRQVIRTLFDNAVRYMIDGGLIVVRIERKNHSIALEIQDTGVGIPPQERSKIFQQFFRGSNVVRMRTEGTGLGLFIARAIMVASGGSLRFTSQEGKGSTFRMSLPVAQPPQTHSCEQPVPKRR